MPRTRKSHPPSLQAKGPVGAIEARKRTTQVAKIFGVGWAVAAKKSEKKIDLRHLGVH